MPRPRTPTAPSPSKTGEQDSSKANAPEFNIYRAEKPHTTDFITDTTDLNYDWNTNYASEGTATKTWNGTDYVWRTNWYWPNNKTYYHFRAAGTGISASGDAAITTDDNNTTADDSDDFDYYPITSGTYAAGTYKDYVWGAPFTDVDKDYKINYSESTGFALQEDSHHTCNRSRGAVGKRYRRPGNHRSGKLILK